MARKRYTFSMEDAEPAEVQDELADLDLSNVETVDITLRASTPIGRIQPEHAPEPEPEPEPEQEHVTDQLTTDTEPFSDSRGFENPPGPTKRRVLKYLVEHDKNGFKDPETVEQQIPKDERPATPIAQILLWLQRNGYAERRDHPRDGRKSQYQHTGKGTAYVANHEIA